MNKIILGLLVLISFNLPVQADEYVSGYTKSNGTYVQPYVRSSPNGTVTDNYSYSGNTNPNTGSVGTNNYTHDVTSPNYTGPDAQGNSGHSGYGTLGSDNNSSNDLLK